MIDFDAQIEEIEWIKPKKFFYEIVIDDLDILQIQ